MGYVKISSGKLVGSGVDSSSGAVASIGFDQGQVESRLMPVVDICFRRNYQRRLFRGWGEQCFSIRTILESKKVNTSVRARTNGLFAQTINMFAVSCRLF